MNIITIGLNHKTAPLEIREKLAFNGSALEAAVKELKELPSIAEVALLSTCNRVEIYASVNDAARAEDEIRDFIAAFHGINKEAFSSALYLHRDADAVAHLLRVSASLDSMVVGEPQILGQIKDAFNLALTAKTTGFILNRLLKKAISTAKRVRTETRIAENAVSISFAAVELAKKIFTGLSDKSVMLLGAGEMAELAARHLVRNGAKDVLIANRTYERGCELALDFGGRAIKFEDMLAELVHTDILICSTNAPDYVLSKEQMLKTMKERRYRPVFLIDISVPRNLAPDINDIDNVYLYNIDDLQQVVDANMLGRRKEAEKAEEIVAEEVTKFCQWFESLESVPVILALRQKAEEIKREEIEKFRASFPGLDNNTLAAVEKLASGITAKLMHGPTVGIKESAEEREIMTYVIKKIYGLDNNGEEQ